MSEKTFKSENGLAFRIRHVKGLVEIYLFVVDEETCRFKFEFSKETFHEVVAYIVKAANEAWSNLNPRDATSEASDYYEYYDKKLGRNGYFEFLANDYTLIIERPFASNLKMYQFNKRKMETLLFDINKKLLIREEQA